jgi:hypothetical protein
LNITGDKLVKRTIVGVLALSFAGSVFAGAVLAETCDFPEHDLTLLPTTDGGAVEVSLELFLNDVTTINDATQSFTSDVFVMAKWQDDRLRHDGQGACSVEGSQIWTPELKFGNRRSLQELLAPELKVKPDGEVTRTVRAYGDFTFREDLSNFPFDHQDVLFTILAGYPLEAVTFIAPGENIGMAEVVSVANWRITFGENRLSGYYIKPLDRTLARLDVVFRAERLTGYYTWQLLVPLILVVMMTWAVFWMPLEFVAPRVGLVATSMLTLIAYRFSMASVLPPIAYLTRMDVFMVASSVLVFAALAAAVAVTHFEGRGDTVKANRINLASRWLAPLLFLIVLARVFAL